MTASLSGAAVAAPHTAAPTVAASTATPAADYPTLAEIRATAQALQGQVLRTPVWRWQAGAVPAQLPAATQLWLKLELWQHTGSFKWRGALANLMALDEAARARGVVAASAGNHALTVAHAAAAVGSRATVVMPHTADPVRVAACRAQGAQVLLRDSMHAAFDTALALVAQQGLSLIHPYDGHRTALGTATVGLELAEQAGPLDAVVVPVGGGGLIGGVAAAIKQLQPGCAVY
ncbi:MAG: serine/threonine dehydratase, partial [Burkholderiales bacterium PBB5]